MKVPVLMTSEAFCLMGPLVTKPYAVCPSPPRSLQSQASPLILFSISGLYCINTFLFLLACLTVSSG